MDLGSAVVHFAKKLLPPSSQRRSPEGAVEVHRFGFGT